MDYLPKTNYPNHLGFRYNMLPRHQMALITSDFVPRREFLVPKPPGREAIAKKLRVRDPTT